MGGVAAALVSAVIGIPVLRLRGIYASLLTFSFGEVVRLLVISDESGLTGGSFGLSGIPGLAFEGLSPDAKQRAYYWLALGLVVLTAIFIYVFIHSPLGTALKALRDSPAYAASRGVSPLKMQVITFGTSAFIAGVAGAFYAQYFGTISPSVMGLGPLSLFVAMLVVGGLGTFWGPMLGTAVIVVVSEVLRDFEEARLIIVGLILLVTIVLAPRGLVPLLQEGWERLQRWMAEDEATEEETTEEVASRRRSRPLVLGAGRRGPVTDWPNGAKAAVAFTFDFDAEEVWIGEDPANADKPGILSQGTYGAKVAVPLVLDVLRAARRARRRSSSRAVSPSGIRDRVDEIVAARPRDRAPRLHPHISDEAVAAGGGAGARQGP